MSKLTLKNCLVYDYFRNHIPANHLNISVKNVFQKHEAEIGDEFGINNYATFNMHVRKCLDWEQKNGRKIEVIRLDNEGVRNG